MLAAEMACDTAWSAATCWR